MFKKKPVTPTPVSLVEFLGTSACAILDHWRASYPNAPMGRTVRVTVTNNGTFFDFPGLTDDLQSEIRDAARTQIFDAITFTNALRDEVTSSGLPLVIDFSLLSYSSRSRGTYHQLDDIDMRVAGMPLATRYNWQAGFDRLIAKLKLIEPLEKGGTVTQWDVMRDISHQAPSELSAKTDEHRGIIYASNMQAACLKAAAQSITIDALRCVLNGEDITPYYAEILRQLRVQPRQPSLLAGFDLERCLKEEPALA